MKDYNGIFRGIEATVIKMASNHLSQAQIEEKLQAFKDVESQKFSDADYYRKLVAVIFYSGYRASTVKKMLPAICRCFHDHITVADYKEKDIEAILLNSEIIRNRRKVEACVKNAHTFKSIVSKFGSFSAYSFRPKESFENLLVLKEDIQGKLEGFGKVTTFHFLTEIGLPVIKPDRVVCRIFKRLGLIESQEELLEAVKQGRQISVITGEAIRYVDYIFVVYGQVESATLGFKGICLEKNPHCEICGVTQYCDYFRNRS